MKRRGQATWFRCRGKCRWRTVVLVAALAGCAAGRAEPIADSASFVARYAAVEDARAETGQQTAPPDRSGVAAEKSAGPSVPPAGTDAQAYYRALIVKEATQQGLAPAIAEAVTAVESGFNPNVVGAAGEIGLMQIMPPTARLLGFTGTTSDLAVPETNIHLGVTYLAQAWRLAGGDLCTAVMKYRAGHGETRFSHLSVDYCLAVRAKLAARGYPVSGSVPAATFGESRGVGCGRKCTAAVSRVGRVDLAALNSKLSVLVMQARGGR
jgi:soluble lytic murein transglycosylase-like protein